MFHTTSFTLRECIQSSEAPPLQAKPALISLVEEIGTNGEERQLVRRKKLLL